MMRLVLLVIWILAIMAATTTASLSQTSRNPVPVDTMCGPKSLLYVCEKLDIDTKLDELSRLSGKNNKGTTMAGLLEAARQKGLTCVGGKMGFSELSTIHTLAIAHLWGNHFVVVEHKGDGVEVVDLSSKDNRMPLETFQSLYSGFVLLLGKGSIAMPESNHGGPDIRLDLDPRLRLFL